MHHSQSPDNVYPNYDYEIVGNIILVPLLDIYLDPEFNCRGCFTPQEVHGLGQTIKQEGQVDPLIIQPIEDMLDKERPSPCPWKFRLIAGHRRHIAMENWTDLKKAKCVIELGLSHQQARALNFTENLQRKDLNILEEAEALLNTWPDYEIKTIARLIGKPKKWVAVRLDLLTLPDYVQKKAAAGHLSQYSIEMLAELHPKDIELVYQELVTTKGKPGQTPVRKGKQRWRSRPRGKIEIGKMVDLLYQHQRFSNLTDESQDYVIAALVWVTKHIKSKEFLEARLGFPEDCVIVDKNDQVTGFKDD